MSAILLTNNSMVSDSDPEIVIGMKYMNIEDVNKKIDELIASHPNPEIVIGKVIKKKYGMGIDFIKVDYENIKVSVLKDGKLDIDGIDYEFNREIHNIDFSYTDIKFAFTASDHKIGDIVYVVIQFK